MPGRGDKSRTGTMDAASFEGDPKRPRMPIKGDQTVAFGSEQGGELRRIDPLLMGPDKPSQGAPSRLLEGRKVFDDGVVPLQRRGGRIH